MKKELKKLQEVAAECAAERMVNAAASTATGLPLTAEHNAKLREAVEALAEKTGDDIRIVQLKQAVAGMVDNPYNTIVYVLATWDDVEKLLKPPKKRGRPKKKKAKAEDEEE